MTRMNRGIAEQLAANIELWIGQDGLAPGTALPERAVAERFKVSRTPVREALHMLARKQVIVQRPEGGYVVHMPP